MKAITVTLAAAGMLLFTTSCDDKDMDMGMNKPYTLKVENVLQLKTLVQSGTFKGNGTPPVILPGQSTWFEFSAGKGQTIHFATMYGWSNDLFFAPANPGIALYDESGQPMQGNVSSQIKLWDNGSKINQAPGSNNPHNSANQNGVVMEVKGTDAQGFSYLPAQQLVKAELTYKSNAVFRLTITNISGGTANETPLSPGVWTVSNYLGGALLDQAPLYTAGQPSANGLTPLAEMGNNSVLAQYLDEHTAVATGLSPVVAVVYNGNTQPIFTIDQPDYGNGLADIAQEGNQNKLVEMLMQAPGVKKVYVLSPSNMPITPGKSAAMQIAAQPGDRLAIATMFGSSNDWFFAFDDMGVVLGGKGKGGDLTDDVKLWNNGTEIDEYPGAGNHQPQFNPNSKNPENKPIKEVDRSMYKTLPAVKDIIRVTLSM